MPAVTILPVTSLKKGRRVYSNEVFIPKGIAGLAADSIILAHQIRTISKDRLIQFLGALKDPGLQTAVNQAVRSHLNL